MTPEQIKTVLDSHKLWLRGKGGERANLFRADLIRANLFKADLDGADLDGANLFRADLDRPIMGL